MAGEDGEAALLRYLSRAGCGGGGQLPYSGTAPLYDSQYALRLAQECNKPRAAVRLMCQLGELCVNVSGMGSMLCPFHILVSFFGSCSSSCPQNERLKLRNQLALL